MMNAKRIALIAALLAGIGAAPMLYSPQAEASDAGALQPKEGWYRDLVRFDFVRANVDIPPKDGVTIIDSRPVARRYDPGHIPGAISIPDSQFDRHAAKLPADTASLLVFYCGGLDCMLSHKSAFKAEQRGYTNIKVYAEGMPDWKARSGPVSVSGAYVRKLIDEKAAYTLIDARPKRVASKGMIPTAINVSYTEFDRNLDKLPDDKSQLLIFYCGGLECVLSDKSAAKARALGYTNVVTYPEGYPEWKSLYSETVAAATTESGAESGAADATGAARDGLRLVPGKEQGSVTVASFERVWKADPASVMLVDVRDAKEFAGGGIRGSVNIPIDTLEKRIESLPLDKPVVFICGTGARSGEAYDMTRLYAPDVQAWFIDGKIRFGPDGSYAMADRN